MPKRNYVEERDVTMPRLAGKSAIVTGATGEIGEATTRRLLEEGAAVMLVGRSPEKLEAVCDRLPSGQRVEWSVAEATDDVAMADAVAATTKAFGGVDILFANAGISAKVAPIEAIEPRNFEQVLHTNVLGVWLAMKHCVEPMKRRGGGSIIATASTAGLVGYPSIAPYVASKHAVCGLIKAAALELAASRIRVNGIAPGPVSNQMMRLLAEEVSPDDPDSVRRAFEAGIPMNRYGTNDEVARFVAFLASDEASYCTGGVFPIDGGFIAG